MKRSILHLLLLSAFLLTGCRSTSELKAVTPFQVTRYLGTWYEAARFPHRFEKGLTSVTAQYSRNPDGTIKVVNRGYNRGKGEWKQAEGIAKFKSDPSLGWLKVSFFGPFYADYKVIYLNESYTEAIVTGPTYKYLWILTREPEIQQEHLDSLISIAAGFGFDTNRIEYIEQAMH